MPEQEGPSKSFHHAHHVMRDGHGSHHVRHGALHHHARHGRHGARKQHGWYDDLPRQHAEQDDGLQRHVEQDGGGLQSAGWDGIQNLRGTQKEERCHGEPRQPLHLPPPMSPD